MGMAASQGRLLSITARISNNEFEQQCVAYSKQRLADDSQKANDEYLDALQATQYQILTGYNGDVPNYEPVCYNQLTSLNSVAVGRQYIVSDNKNQIVVPEKIAQAFGEKHVDFNTFLKNVSGGKLTQVSEPNVTEADVHDAWDKYLVSVIRGHQEGMFISYDENGKAYLDHTLGFSYHESKTDGGETVSYVTYRTSEITGSAGNKIYIQEGIEGGDPYYYYRNLPVEVEAYTKDDGTMGYLAKYRISDVMDDGYNLMQDSEYIYLNNVYVEPSGNGYTYYKARYNAETGEIERIKDASGNYEMYDNHTINGQLFVSQDYGSNLSEPNIVEITSDNPDPSKTKGAFTDTTTAENTIFYQGTTAEQRELYDYAMAVSEKYAKGNKLEYDGDQVQYYRNIYQEMITRGFTTFAQMVDDKYINTMTYDLGNGQPVGVADETQAFQNDNWLINLIKNGKLAISYYDSTAQGFVKTTLDDDESIVERENKSKMAIAEQVYQGHMNRIEKQDKKFDMQLTKLESEHTALTTEYDSVAKVISKNVEKSFNVFNA